MVFNVIAWVPVTVATETRVGLHADGSGYCDGESRLIVVAIAKLHFGVWFVQLGSIAPAPWGIDAIGIRIFLIVVPGYLLMQITKYIAKIKVTK